MSEATPTSLATEESRFEISELFFSRTDLHGVILDGNEVFVRVSEHPREKLIGAPHNLIRHPDMPRSVFKLLWSYLDRKEPIAAYVKNRSRTGRYYWVLAIVFPGETEHTSIRLKPTSPILGIVQKLYAETKVQEKGNLDAGLAFVVKSLADLGFESYDAFMTHALTEEILAREQALQGRVPAAFPEMLRMVEQAKAFQKASERLVKTFEGLDRMSINMAIAAEKLGANGQTLSTVSLGFRKVGDEIEAEAGPFFQAVTEMKASLRDSQFVLGAMQMQAEIISFFSKEAGAATSAEEIERFELNSRALKALSIGYGKRVSESMHTLESRTNNSLRRVSELRAAAAGLKVIRISGRVEAARLPVDASQDIHHNIDSMNQFIADIEAPLASAATAMAEFNQSLHSLISLVKL